MSKSGKADQPLHAAPDNDGYEVGYGKPPTHSQFKKGNRAGKGRPKGTKNLKTIVNEAFGAKVPAKINGKTVKLTKSELAIHQLANKASGGDIKAITTVIALQERYGPQEDPEGPSPHETQADLETLRDYLKIRDLFEPGGPSGDES